MLLWLWCTLLYWVNDSDVQIQSDVSISLWNLGAWCLCLSLSWKCVLPRISNKRPTSRSITGLNPCWGEGLTVSEKVFWMLFWFYFYKKKLILPLQVLNIRNLSCWVIAFTDHMGLVLVWIGCIPSSRRGEFYPPSKKKTNQPWRVSGSKSS